MCQDGEKGMKERAERLFTDNIEHGYLSDSLGYLAGMSNVSSSHRRSCHTLFAFGCRA